MAFGIFFVVEEEDMADAPAWMLRIFEASDYMLEIGVPVLRILALAWLMGIPAAMCFWRKGCRRMEGEKFQ